MRYQTLDIEQIIAPGRPKKGQRLPTPEELNTVRTQGVPIAIGVVADNASDTQPRFKLVTGYEWWKAAMLCKLMRVPAVIHTNEARTLDAKSPRCPIARARAIQSLIEQTPNLTLKDLAARLGTTLSSLSHYLRLLGLPASIQHDIEKGAISYGQARVLLGLQSTNDQLQLASVVKVQRLSVRTLERVVRLMVESGMVLKEALAAAKKNIPPNNRAANIDKASIRNEPVVTSAKDPNIIQLEQQLSAQLGSKVEIRATENQKGELVIKYDNLDIFEGILDQLLQRQREFDWE